MKSQTKEKRKNERHGRRKMFSILFKFLSDLDLSATVKDARVHWEPGIAGKLFIDATSRSIRIAARDLFRPHCRQYTISTQYWP